MKVHFASYQNFWQAIDAAGVNYALESFYSLRSAGKKGSNGQRVVVEAMNRKRHAILDSGLFTLMFGAKAGSRLDKAFFRKWMDDYVAFVQDTGFKHSIVELDIQKKTDPETAWEFRKALRKRVKNTVISVYHLEDGKPDRLVDWAEYVAVSIPELRLNVDKDTLIRITDYIVNRALKRGIRVHLLGCTQADLMRRFRHATTCDSTSWRAGGRFGKVSTTTYGTFHVNHLKAAAEIDPSWRNAHKTAYYECVLKLADYTRFAGDQS